MPKVYVVDDSISVRKAIERLLQQEGLDVIGTGRGREAVAQLEHELPDLIICDLILPDVDGFEVCRFVKESPLLATTPVLLISGVVNEQIRRKASQVRADGIFKKPFVGDELGTVVRSYLHGQAARRRPPLDPTSPSRLASKGETTKLEILAQLEELQYALILGPGGQRESELGSVPGNADLAAMGIDQLAKFAATISLRLGRGEMKGVVLETGKGCVLIRQLPGERTLVVSLANTWALGKARFFSRRIANALQTPATPQAN